MEGVLENRHRPKPGGTVVSFPGPVVRHRPPNPSTEPMT